LSRTGAARVRAFQARTRAAFFADLSPGQARRGADDFALHLELFTIRRAPGKLKYLAGSDSGMGAFANDVAPEAAAERLRQLG
jgi:UDPglucose--hexose-1-phosphate uridylyltransferase